MIISNRDLAEKELLYALLYENAFKVACGTVQSTDFVIQANRTIYEVMTRLWGDCGVLSISSLIDELALLGHGVDYSEIITTYIQHTESTDIWKELLKRLRARSKKDELKAIAKDITNRLEVGEEELSRFQSMLTESNKPKNIKSPKENIGELMEIVCDKFAGKANGTSTGFEALDYLIGGFVPQNLYIIAARPKCGKTAIKQQMARNIARAGGQSLLMCCEMSAKMEMLRMASADCRIPTVKIQRGKISEKELKDFSDSLINIFFNNGIDAIGMSGVSTTELCAGINHMFRDKHYDVVFVDQLQALRFDGRYLVQEMGKATKSLRTIANKHNTAVVLLCQLNRATDKNEGGIPQLSNLRDSGDIEQDADVVMFIHREKDKSKESVTRECQLIVAASRYGMPGYIDMTFHGPTMTFAERVTEYEG